MVSLYNKLALAGTCRFSINQKEKIMETEGGGNNPFESRIRSADLLVKTALASPEILDNLKTKPEETLKKLGADAVNQLPRVAPPDTRTSNAIWIIVVGAFAIVMLGAAFVLGSGVGVKLETGATYATRGDTMLTVFTTVVAFLAGLLSQSPVSKG